MSDEPHSLFRFRIRPCYHKEELLVEFCGDHRSPEFPNVPGILATALSAKMGSSTTEASMVAIATDCYPSSWTYSGGEYFLDDDTWGLWIHAWKNNQVIMKDLENALVHSGFFVKEEVDYARYA